MHGYIYVCMNAFACLCTCVAIIFTAMEYSDTPEAVRRLARQFIDSEA